MTELEYREKRVLVVCLANEGNINKIANTLLLSKAHVRKLLNSATAKMGATTHLEAAHKAQQDGKI